MEVGIVELEYYRIFHPTIIRLGDRENSTPSPHPELTPDTKTNATSDWGQKKKREKTVNAFLWRSSLWNPSMALNLATIQN
jgi:hypothetical protein